MRAATTLNEHTQRHPKSIEILLNPVEAHYNSSAFTKRSFQARCCVVLVHDGRIAIVHLAKTGDWSAHKIIAPQVKRMSTLISLSSDRGCAFRFHRMNRLPPAVPGGFGAHTATFRVEAPAGSERSESVGFSRRSRPGRVRVGCRGC